MHLEEDFFTYWTKEDKCKESIHFAIRACVCRKIRGVFNVCNAPLINMKNAWSLLEILPIICQIC